MQEVEDTEEKDYRLDVDSELRFEIERDNAKVHVVLISGKAELFGTELVKNKKFVFSTGAKVAIFTFHGCVINITGKMDVVYTSRETPMIQYLNCHCALEKARAVAEKNDERGPVAMLCGPMDVGKSTLARIFLNYAARQGRRPLFADLDVGQGSISIPGTISTILIERPAGIEEGFSQKAPLVFHYGHKSLGDNNVLYKIVVDKMAKIALHSLKKNKRTKYSGIIINTCGWVKNGGYMHLLNTAESFQVSTIFVLDQERLYNELLRDMPPKVQVVLLPKSGGVVERSRQLRQEARELRIKEYFYGSRTRLYPFSFEAKFQDLKIYKIGAPALPDSCMPIGMKADDNKTKLVSVAPGPSLLHHLLSITYATSITDDIIGSNIAGFVCVTDVDMKRQTLMVLSPQTCPLPNTILLLSDLQFVDSDS